jgi:FKBP-type peptidyl-prolyl cis-trans isomerase SlpA
MSDTPDKARIALRDVELAPLPPAATECAVDEIGPGRKVTLHFALLLDGGEEIDSNFGRAPVGFVVGDGSLLPGFEQVLFGLKAGARQEFLLAPEQAFGVFNEDNVQRFPLYQFPPDLSPCTGLMIDFADAAGNTQAGVVRGFDKQYVEVDFNHPLAGRSIRFSVHVHKVEPV